MDYLLRWNPRKGTRPANASCTRKARCARRLYGGVPEASSGQGYSPPFRPRSAEPSGTQRACPAEPSGTRKARRILTVVPRVNASKRTGADSRPCSCGLCSEVVRRLIAAVESPVYDCCRAGGRGTEQPWLGSRSAKPNGPTNKQKAGRRSLRQKISGDLEDGPTLWANS